MGCPGWLPQHPASLRALKYNPQTEKRKRHRGAWDGWALPSSFGTGKSIHILPGSRCRETRERSAQGMSWILAGAESLSLSLWEFRLLPPKARPLNRRRTVPLLQSHEILCFRQVQDLTRQEELGQERTHQNGVSFFSPKPDLCIPQDSAWDKSQR